MEEENKDLINMLLEKGILKTWYGNHDYFNLPLPNRPDLEISSIRVKKEDLRKLVEGAVKEIKADIHEDIERASQYHDDVLDVKFYDGTATIIFDREKQIFNTKVSGSSYWDTSTPSCGGPSHG